MLKELFKKVISIKILKNYILILIKHSFKFLHNLKKILIFRIIKVLKKFLIINQKVENFHLKKESQQKNPKKIQ